MTKHEAINRLDNIKTGDTISHRWNDSMQWSLGIFIGETSNGFEVYEYCIEREDRIEYAGQISTDGYGRYGEPIIHHSDKFKDRNYNNFNFSR
jgi:hypothetical protein